MKSWRRYTQWCSKGSMILKTQSASK